MIRVVYTNAINDANPCACSYPSKAFMSYSIDESGTHEMVCSRCDFSVQNLSFDLVIALWNDINRDKWNNDNPKTDPSWQQVTELAQAGKMDEAAALYNQTFRQAQDELLTKIIDQKQLVLNAFYAMFVKKTADELPDDNVNVLLWKPDRWIEGYLFQDSWWSADENEYLLDEIEYWLPLPTFNPEREG